MSRWLHQTVNSRGDVGLSSAFTRPMRTQMTDSPWVSENWRPSASPQTLLTP